MSRALLPLRLEGYLQSWGDRARWSVRDTRRLPTKSGVVGLLACALGWGHDRSDAITTLARELRFGARADRPGELLRDYHTVQGGVLEAAGKYRGKIKKTASTGEPETVLSEREYLADACFLVVLEGPPDRLEQVRAALADPVWPIYLGRKACPPSAPLLPALPRQDVAAAMAGADPLAECLRTHPWLGSGAPPECLRCELELPLVGAPSGWPESWRSDQTGSLAPRTFDWRRVASFECPCPSPEEDHDQ